MADSGSKNTTGAVHLTSIDLDITGVQQSLQAVRDQIDETVKYVRESMSNATPVADKGTKGTGFEILKKGAEEADNAAKVTKKSVEALLGQYLSLQKQMLNFRASTDAQVDGFNTLRGSIDQNIMQLKQFVAAFDSLDDDELGIIKNMSSELITFRNTIKEADNELIKSGEAYDNQVKKIANLSMQFTNLQKAMRLSGLDENTEKFKQIQNSANEGAQAVKTLYDYIQNEGNGKGFTDAQITKFSELSRQVKVATTDFSAMKEQAYATGDGLKKVTESIDPNKFISNINAAILAYRDFQSALKTSGLDDSAGTQLDNLSTYASEYSKNLEQLRDTIIRSGTVQKNQVDMFNEMRNSLPELNTQLRELKANAKFEGEGFKLPSIDQATASIEKIIKKYAEFQNTLSKSRLEDSIGTPLSNIRQKADSARAELENLTSSIRESGAVTEQQKKRYEELDIQLSYLQRDLKDADTAARNTGNGFKTLGNNADFANNSIKDMLNRLADKAKWMLAFQLVSLVQNAFGNIIGTIKETEDAVIELQRVLNEPLDNTAISKELYDMAYEFGQTFENVQNVAVKFAQTGLSWKETIDATRATMLGLNTAELEVSTATEGLIAVMAQFGYKAEDLEGIIDRINITADNFPVTSEKIVAALQRAGGTASAFGLTLEETIGLITALSEATGRSGQNIGTALNSLISFSMKESSLEKFSEYLGGIDLAGRDVLEIWQLLGAKIDDSGESLAKMMAGSEEFADLFNEELASAIGLTEEYNTAMMNSQDVYSSVGTYRQNYFIALLNNISAVTEAMQGMTTAEGYSIKENETAMESFSKRWNQLVADAKTLAVEFGEAGFLDLLKGLVKAGDAVVKLTKQFGGLKTVLMAISTLIFAAKKEKIDRWFVTLSDKVKAGATSFQTLNRAVVAYHAATASGATATQALSVAIGTLKLSIGGVLSIVSLAITAISALVGAWNSAKQAAKEYREEAIKAGNEAAEQANDIYEAYKKFKELGDEQSTIDLFGSLGYNEADIDRLINKYGSLEKAINAVLESQYIQMKNDAQIAKQAAYEAFQDIETVGPVGQYQKNQAQGWREAYDALKDYSDELGIYVQKQQGYVSYMKFDALNEAPKTYEAAKESVERLTKAKEILDKTLVGAEENEYYQQIVDTIGNLNEKIEDFEKSSSDLEMLGEDVPEWMENMANAADRLSEAVNNASSDIDNFTYNFDEAKERIEALSDSFDELSSAVDNFQSAYSTIVDAIDEYNETGIMTADMLQSLLELEPEYLQMLDIKTNSLGLNTDAVGNLINANDAYLQQLAALRVAEYAQRLETELAQAAIDGKTLAEVQAANATALLTTELGKAILGEINGTNTSNQLAQALQNVARSAGLSGDMMNYFTNTISDYTKQVSSLLNMTGKGTSRTYYTPKISTGGGSSKSSGNSKQKQALEAQKEELDNQLKILKKQKDAQKDYYDELIERWKKQKEFSDEYYDSEIDKLNELQEAQERLNEEMDYYVNRQKILRNLEQAQSRSGIEWREKEAEYQQDLIDLDNEWRDKQQKWSVEDQISQLKLLKEQAADIIEEEIERLQALKDAAVEQFDLAIEKLNDSIQALSKKISSATTSGVAAGAGAAVVAAGNQLDKIDEKFKKTFDNMKIRTKDYFEIFEEANKNVLKNNVFMTLEESNKKVSEETERLIKKYESLGYTIINKVGPQIKNGLTSAFQGMDVPLEAAARKSAIKMANAFQNNFFDKLMGGMKKIQDRIMNTNIGIPTTKYNFGNTPVSTSNTNNVNMFNSINSAASARNAMKGLEGILNSPNRLR